MDSPKISQALGCYDPAERRHEIPGKCGDYDLVKALGKPEPDCRRTRSRPNERGRSTHPWCEGPMHPTEETPARGLSSNSQFHRRSSSRIPAATRGCLELE